MRKRHDRGENEREKGEKMKTREEKEHEKMKGTQRKDNKEKWRKGK